MMYGSSLSPKLWPMSETIIGEQYGGARHSGPGERKAVLATFW